MMPEKNKHYKQETLNDLIELGLTTEAKPEVLKKLLGYQGTLCLSEESWREIIIDFDRIQLDSLIRGLTKLGKQYKYGIGGSVSPVSTLFRIFWKLYPAHEPELCHWIVNNSCCSYDPFGAQRQFKAYSFEEFLSKDLIETQARNKIVDANIKKEKIKQAEFKVKRVEKATYDLIGAVKRGDLNALKGLVLKGGDVLAKTEESLTLLDIAKKHNKSHIHEYLDSLECFSENKN
jgi:hypothetical protein